MASDGSSTSESNDATPLLQKRDGAHVHNSTGLLTINAALSPLSVLPISFLAALGMAATAATSIFAYATLLCKDPTHCEASEQKGYASSVALSVSIANICGMLVLSSLEKISRTHLRVGLGLWIVCRSMSIAVLALGVYFNSIVIALSGRIFEGLASDNLLHFSLNTVYIRTAADEAQVTRLIGASLALFMIGISISPVIAGLFQDFIRSFFMAGLIFVFSLLYLLILVGKNPDKSNMETNPSNDLNPNPTQHILVCDNTIGGLWGWFLSVLRSVVSPLELFYSRPTALLSGVALSIYTSVQSYIFSLIMVHTSLAFGFTGKQNGLLLTIVHAVAASYLFLVLFIIPRLTTLRTSHQTPISKQQEIRRNPIRDAKLALLSLFLQILALLGFANASQAWEIYATSAILALGLATPSFIKSHFLGFFEREEGGKAVGALAMMETIGALLSPLLLGAWQVLWPGSGVFYGAAGMMVLAAGCFFVAALFLRSGLKEEMLGSTRVESQPGV